MDLRTLRLAARAPLPLLLLVVLTGGATAQDAVRYTVALEDPAERVFRVTAEFPALGEELHASLPRWTPGSYDLENYARNVRGFAAEDGTGRTLEWDRLDPDTWRVRTAGADVARLSFEVYADSLDLDKSKIFDDFAFFNGTNLFPYEEERTGRPAELTLELPEGWQVATGLSESAPMRFTAASYDDLVDAPTFLGRFQLDRFTAGGKPARLAVYPVDAFTEPQRARLRQALDRILTVQNAIVGAAPYDSYTTLIYVGEASFAGGLEHANSHFDVLPPQVAEGFDSALPIVQSLLAHETFHLWNVKRIRPAAMWPYEYDQWQPTELLWFSEGVTDYYADLTVVRAGLFSPEQFFGEIAGNLGEVAGQPASVAVEDASLATWIDPTWGDQYIYYPKGSLVGLLLDLRIRSASGNARSLDDVVRELYSDFYARGRGFTTADLLRLLEEAGDTDVDDFYARYVTGREPLPVEATLALAGLRVERRELRVPVLGLAGGTGPDGRVVVQSVVPGSPAADAGVGPGDLLLAVGEVEVGADPAWGERFRALYAERPGARIPMRIVREGREQLLEVAIEVQTQTAFGVSRDPSASAAARVILDDLLDAD
ncbi:MAG: M61 family metallopeptidase [Gemmatimonadota bacterium]